MSSCVDVRGRDRGTWWVVLWFNEMHIHYVNKNIFQQYFPYFILWTSGKYSLLIYDLFYAQRNWENVF